MTAHSKIVGGSPCVMPVIGTVPPPPAVDPQRRHGPNWNYHVSQLDPAGRIYLPADVLHPDDGHLPDPSGRVDITGLVGTKVRMNRKGIQRLLGSFKAIDFLVEVGVFHVSDHANEPWARYYYMDPGDTLKTCYLRWEEDLPIPVTAHEFRMAKRVRRSCQVEDGHWPPQVVIVGAARVLGPRKSFTRGEVRGLVTLSNSNAKEVVRAIKEEAGKEYIINCYKAGQRPVTEQELAKRVPYLKGVAGTCFDPHLKEEYRSPDATTRARLSTIRIMFPSAATFAYTHAPSIRLPMLLPRYMRSVARFEAEALANDPSFDPTLVASLEKARDHVAFGKLAISYPPHARDQIVRDTLHVLRRAHSRIRDIDPRGSKKLLQLQPAMLPNQAAFWKRLEEEYGSKRAGQRERRKKVSHRISDRYEKVIDGAAFRIAQISLDGDATRATIDYLEEPENAHLAYWDFEVEDETLSTRGLPVGLLHERLYRCWRVPAAELSVELERDPSEEPPPQMWPGASARRNEAHITARSRRKETDGKGGQGKPLRLHGTQYIIEFLGVTCAENDQSAEAWYVTLAKHHSLSATGLLDAGQNTLRETLAKKWQLPNQIATAGGLVGFDQRRGRIARVASQTDRPVKRTFVPIEELEHALRLAGHGLDCVIQTWCRSGEFRQQTEYKEDWDPQPDQTQFGWRCIPKLAPGAPIPDPLPFIGVSNDTREEAMNLAAICVRRCHPGGHIPDVVPIGTLAWKCRPQPYIFSCGSRMVDAKTLNYALRLLFANIGEFRFHDFRHAGSNRSRNDGKSLTEIRAGLRSRRMANADYYSELSPLQIALQEQQVVKDKLGRIARETHERSLT